ncbi:MAG: hypothetical protein Q8O93_02010 [bacterium]|nr:hypothetical protein [bacterium]
MAKKINFLITGCCLIIILLPSVSLAANQALDKLNQVGVTAGPYEAVGEDGLAIAAGIVIQAILAVIGIIFLALMLYAGYNWMTARGEQEKVDKAKDTIQRSIIGLIIIVGAYAIWRFVSQIL